MLTHGECVAQDNAEAVRFYRLAAEQGNDSLYRYTHSGSDL